MSTVEAPPADRVDSGAPLPRGHGLGPWLVALARRAWRQLTSMRTALVLLFLLAVAAIPGSLLPQRNTKIEDVNQYLRTHGELGRTLDRFYLFDVFSSPWFSAIYLLLFVSLVGCLVPRLRDHVRALLRQPPDGPSRLDRMPAYVGGTGGDPEQFAALLRKRRFRVAVRGTTVSAEKGYLKESGNLLFHFALLAMLIGVAISSWYGWHGSRNIVAGRDGEICNTVPQYDDYGLGARVGPGDLPPFCVRLDRFEATYAPNGQPTAFRAHVHYSQGSSGTESPAEVQVNHPLRISGAGVYLLGHGYAPVIRYTDRFGKSQTSVQPFLNNDENLTGTGAAAFPDANIDPATGKQDPNDQIGFQGVYLPTMSSTDMTRGASLHPEERNPRLLLVAYKGNLGMDAGIPRSVYTLDESRIASGRLAKVAESKALRPGESLTLPDGSKVEFVGTRAFVTVTVRHDPGEMIVLGAAVFLLAGLLLSLWGKRRRIWLRVNGDRVDVGGLPRTDYPGFAAEFDEIVQAARKEGILR
ncbi:cytochrome c biogenesis protein ResB [Planosporangium mesophilum]|uniref:Cytochrome c biogenesis protein n=1 Tax=Planosporangium mesophilum TaxID=689768 RepID=A0A8J3TH74_9ACTN|nr:cytochrome c biogenesis protein ResB [Planosporangium mesophilum]NJC82098.1 cytochrome c biogenesis protein ResB [Planosporangium mesophilum]GII26398.1 cytochrome c biogenesis protein [Planosporangium mesophilum]